MAQAVRRISLVDQVVDAVTERIADGELREGDSLSTQVLGREFDVSKTVVREAIADLAARGLVRRSQGRETVVVMPGSDELRRLIAFRIRAGEVGLIAVQEVREALEVYSAELAASRRTEEELATLAECLSEMRSASNDDAFIEADISFHRTLASASKNPLIEIVLDAFAPLLRESRDQTVAEWRARQGSLEPIVENHARINEAVVLGDPGSARAAMQNDLAETRRTLEMLAGATGAGTPPAVARLNDEPGTAEGSRDQQGGDTR